MYLLIGISAIVFGIIFPSSRRLRWAVPFGVVGWIYWSGLGRFTFAYLTELQANNFAARMMRAQVNRIFWSFYEDVGLLGLIWEVLPPLLLAVFVSWLCISIGAEFSRGSSKSALNG